MPKNRSTVFTVVREINQCPFEGSEALWHFHGLVGTYLTAQRADEVAATTMQRYIDMGMNPEIPEYRCTVKPSTWYEE